MLTDTMDSVDIHFDDSQIAHTLNIDTHDMNSDMSGRLVLESVM